MLSSSITTALRVSVVATGVALLCFRAVKGQFTGVNKARIFSVRTRASLSSTTLALVTQAAARCISIFGNVDSVVAVVGRTGREWLAVRRAELVGAVGPRFFFFRFAVASRRCCKKA